MTTIRRRTLDGYLGKVWVVEDAFGRVFFVESTRKRARETLSKAQPCQECPRLVREGQFICPDCNTPTAAYFAYLERERREGGSR